MRSIDVPHGYVFLADSSSPHLLVLSLSFVFCYLACLLACFVTCSHLLVLSLAYSTSHLLACSLSPSLARSLTYMIFACCLTCLFIVYHRRPQAVHELLRHLASLVSDTKPADPGTLAMLAQVLGAMGWGANVL